MIEPAQGGLPPSDTKGITVVVRPNPNDLFQSELNTFARVRTGDGFCGERYGLEFNCRIPIKAYNLPALSAIPAAMDFSTSQPGETRVLILTLINLLSIDCPCTLFLTPLKSVFQLPQNTYTLGPKEKRYITIKFTPNEFKKYSAKIGIVAFGGQVQW